MKDIIYIRSEIGGYIHVMHI